MGRVTCAVVGVLRNLERHLTHGRLKWLDGYPFWLARLRRSLHAHHNARIQVGVFANDADTATQALIRAGWSHVATSPADDERSEGAQA